MEGWIKLWRKVKNDGHMKMPGTAFKLWIYCLLEAAPRPDRARGLEAGELWLNYEHVRQVIGETGRQMSKSTVAGALRYLEQNGYLTRQTKQFYGLKVRLLNRPEGQSGSTGAPDATPAPSPVDMPPVGTHAPETGTPAMAGATTMPITPGTPPGASTGVPTGTPADTSAGTLTGKVERAAWIARHGGTPASTSTETPAGTPAGEVERAAWCAGHSGTPAGTPAGTPTGTATVPGPVPARPPRPYSGAARRPLEKKKNKELKNQDFNNPSLNNQSFNNQDFKPLVVDLITSFEQEFGRPLSPLEIDRLTGWRKTMPEGLIREALIQAVLRNKRTLAYTGGILLNWQQAGIRTVDEARRDTSPPGRPPGKPAAAVDPAVAKKKAFIKSLYM